MNEFPELELTLDELYNLLAIYKMGHSYFICDTICEVMIVDDTNVELGDKLLDAIQISIDEKFCLEDYLGYDVDDIAVKPVPERVNLRLRWLDQAINRRKNEND